MTANQIAAYGNQIAAQRNELEAERNAIQARYNESYLGETARHNQSMESINAEANNIAREFNEGKLLLDSRSLEINAQLQTIEREMKYANEERKRQLEAEANKLTAERNRLTEQSNFEVSRHNQALEVLQSDATYAQIQHQVNQDYLKGEEVKVARLNADIQALKVRYDHAVDMLNAATRAEEAAIQRESNLLNYSSNKRKQNLDYDIRWQELQQTKTRDDRNFGVSIANTAGNILTGIGEVIIGRGGLGSFISSSRNFKSQPSPFSQYTTDPETAKKLDELFRR